MKIKILSTVLLVEVLANAGGGGGFRRKKGGGGDGESLTPGNLRPNKNLNSLNTLSGVGCRIVEINDPLLMAVSNQFLKSFLNCGRCARVTCVGNSCPLVNGRANSVITRVVSKTTISKSNYDIEVNDAAWKELMGDEKSKALPGMTINWQFVDCPEHGRRQKLYVLQDPGSKMFKVQPVDFNKKIKWMKIKSGAPNGKYMKTKDPAKSKADHFYRMGKLKGPELVAPVGLYMQYVDGEKIKVEMSTWAEGKFSYIDGLAAPEGVQKGPTQTKNDNMNFEVLGGLFGHNDKRPNTSKPKTTTATTTTTTHPRFQIKTTTSTTTTTTTTTRKITTKKPKPTKPPRSTKPPRTKKPKKPKGSKGGKGSKGKSPFNSPVGYSPVEDPPRVQQSAIRDNIDAFVDDLLSPFLFGAPMPQPTRATTTTARTTKKSFIGGGSPQTLTGVGAPSHPTAGSCGISNPHSNTLFVAIHKKHASKSDCGKCVFLWCPSFGGCPSGSPLQKAQIVDIYDGSADIAMSTQVFKIVTGKAPTNGNLASVFMGMWNIRPC